MTRTKRDVAAPPPRTLAERDLYERIEEGRYKAWKRAVEEVAAFGAQYVAELERGDNAHEARLASRWRDLSEAIERAAAARAEQRKPVMMSDLDRERRHAAHLAALDSDEKSTP